MPRIFMVKEGNLILMKHSVFTTGDAYLIVDEESQKIWIWLGKSCSVDEKGTAAVEARRIDDGEVFKGQAQIITLDQGDESPEFLSKMGGLKILDKNLAKSMLKDVSTGEFADQANHVNALYRVSAEEFDGMDAMKYLQVPLERSSLDSEDCFVADLGVDVWVWQGKTSSVKEKVKAMQIAREFDATRTGDQKPRIFMDADDDADFLAIFEGIFPSQDRETVELTPDKEFQEPPATPQLPPEEITPHPPAEPPKEITPPPAEPPKEITPPPAEHHTPVKEEPKEIPTPSPNVVSSPPREYSESSKRVSPGLERSTKTSSSTADGKILIQTTSGRTKCPRCGNDKYNMFREVQDNSNIIMDYPRVYGKKYICGKCGAEFKKKSDY